MTHFTTDEHGNQDFHHAGYYGRYVPPAAGTTLPDPCVTGTATTLANALPFPVQAYIASSQTTYPDFTGTSSFIGKGCICPEPEVEIMTFTGIRLPSG